MQNDQHAQVFPTMRTIEHNFVLMLIQFKAVLPD
jgi:hypothetical protein